MQWEYNWLSQELAKGTPVVFNNGVHYLIGIVQGFPVMANNNPQVALVEAIAIRDMRVVTKMSGSYVETYARRIENTDKLVLLDNLIAISTDALDKMGLT